MSLPRRTPWADLSELDEVCRWIYGENSSKESRKAAYRRLCAWRCNTALPHALNVTIGLLSVTLEDADAIDNPGPSSTKVWLALRQAYALAIVRLVNELVDTLQTGLYARPVAAVAAQIGLPAWFVELRHEATHGDLPSLAVLREAAKEALTWLLHRYFIPTLASPDSLQSGSASSISPIEPLLKRYKALIKDCLKDATLLTKSKGEIEAIYRDVEKWIGEAKVAAWGSSVVIMEDEGDSQETWALDQLCDVLLAKGGLVPVSKKKRPKPDNKVESPPNQAVWTPLLTHLASHHPTFPNRLVQGILSILCEVGGYISYKWSLAGWIIWAADTWEDNPDCTPEGLVKLLMELLGTNEGGDENDRALIKILLRTLTSDGPILKAKTKLLMKAIESQSEAARSQTESSAADVVAEMAGRLTHLQDELKKRSGAGTDDVEISEEGAQSMEGILPTDLDIGPGWTLLTEENWKPCPIGVFYTTSVN